MFRRITNRQCIAGASYFIKGRYAPAGAPVRARSADGIKIIQGTGARRHYYDTITTTLGQGHAIGAAVVFAGVAAIG